MPAFPPSLRLIATPLWGLARLWEWAIERQRPYLELDGRGKGQGITAEQVDAFAQSDARGLHLVFDGTPMGGWATLEGLRVALGRARESGKLVTVEAGRFGNAELYLGSVADRVWIHPTGEVAAVGVAATLMFGGSLLDKLGLKFDVEAAGAYKSFGETFSRAFSSPENREATRALVSDLQAQLDAAVADGRHLGVDVVRAALANAPLSSSDAESAGLVDGVLYRDQVQTQLNALYSDAPRRNFRTWARAQRWRRGLEQWIEGRPRVVVLHLEGNVIDGEGADGQAIASGPVCRALEDLRDDDGVVGVVLAIRSPGGSATASDAIWRSVRLLVEKKPVVAAFGDVAASGGYYIGVACNEIVARAGTITGSIGVVGGKPVIGGLLDRLGVSTEVVTERETADMYSLFRPFSPLQRARFRASLDRFYHTFVDRVSAGRRAPWNAVEQHARGRVWTGTAALERGLIDRIGGVDDAVARVRALTAAPAVSRSDYWLTPRTPMLKKLLRRSLGAEASTPGGVLAKRIFGHLDGVNELLQAWQDGRPLAWLPWRVDP